MSCKNTYTRNLTEIESHRAYANRVIEEYFNVTDIDAVSYRYFQYLLQIDERIDIFNTSRLIAGNPPQLRKINFIDLMNQEVEDKFREPYFIFADVSDFANYDNDLPDPDKRGLIYYTNNPDVNDGTSLYQMSYNGITNTMCRTGYGCGSPILTGRGTIVIDMEQENAGKIYYKIRITTLPHFVKWAYFVIQYITKGNYNIEMEVPSI